MKTTLTIIILMTAACMLYAFDDAECRLVRVIDGDTIVCDIDGWPEIVGRNMSVRMRGCDSPEVHTVNLTEKKLGLRARAELMSKLEGTDTLMLKNIGQGKYFRLVADIYMKGEKLTCMENRLAYVQPAYKCGAKTQCSQMADCAEALFYFNSCGTVTIDRDNDGVPCEDLCQ